MRSQSLQQDIGGDLEDNVRDEEYCQCGIILISRQPQIVAHVKNVGIGDIGPIEKSEEVDDAQDWNDPEVDPGNDSALGGMWRACHLQVIQPIIISWEARIVVIMPGGWAGRFGRL